MALRRARRAEFSEFQKMKQVRDFIDNNPELFVREAEFAVNTVLHHFRLFAPSYEGLTPEQIITAHQSYTNKRCQWQNRFNRVLAQRGMYMTKKYNSDHWHIKTNREVEAKIQGFMDDSRRNRARSTELRRGFNSHHNVYRHVPNGTLRQIVENSNPADWSGWSYVDPDVT